MANPQCIRDPRTKWCFSMVLSKKMVDVPTPSSTSTGDTGTATLRPPVTWRLGIVFGRFFSAEKRLDWIIGSDWIILGLKFQNYNQT